MSSHLERPNWEILFDNCHFATNQFRRRSLSIPDCGLYTIFHITNEITTEDIDHCISIWDFKNTSTKFWYGTILHACVAVLTLSDNHENSRYLLYLMQWLLENKIVDESTIDTFEDTAIDLLVCSMKHRAHSTLTKCEKHTNLSLIHI